MKLFLSNLAIAIIFASCSHKAEDKYSALLEGDWVNNNTEESGTNGYQTFSFEDSLCSLTNCYSYTNYTVLKDTLIIQPERKPIFPNEYIKRFWIASLNKDSLILKALTNGKQVEESILLAKIKPKNELRPLEIYFSSSSCLGYCPAMQLKIDSSGKFLFFSGYLSKVEGIYSGVLSKTKHQFLINKIQNLSLDSILPVYNDSNVTDMPMYGVIINTKNKQFIYSVYGSRPVELTILLFYLMDLYNHIELKTHFVISTSISALPPLLVHR